MFCLGWLFLYHDSFPMTARYFVLILTVSVGLKWLTENCYLTPFYRWRRAVAMYGWELLLPSWWRKGKTGSRLRSLLPRLQHPLPCHLLHMSPLPQSHPQLHPLYLLHQNQPHQDRECLFPSFYQLLLTYLLCRLMECQWIYYNLLHEYRSVHWPGLLNMATMKGRIFLTPTYHFAD